MKKLLLFAIALLSVSAAFAGEDPLPPEVMQAKTVYIVKGVTFYEKKDPTGQATFVEPCRAEINKWGRFKEVTDAKQADLILRISNVDPHGRNVQGVTNYHTVNITYPLTSLEVFQRSTGKLLWSVNHNWGGLTLSAKTGTTDVAKAFRKRVEEQEKAETPSK